MTMTMNQPAAPQVLILQGWFQSACRSLELSPPNRRPDSQRQASAPEPPQTVEALTSVIAACPPTEQHCTLPVVGTVAVAAPIDPQDWDLLFQAVLETAMRVARQPTSTNGAVLQLQAPGDVWGECLAALDHLRRSVPVQQQRLS